MFKPTFFCILYQNKICLNQSLHDHFLPLLFLFLFSSSITPCLLLIMFLCENLCSRRHCTMTYCEREGEFIMHEIIIGQVTRVHVVMSSNWHAYFRYIIQTDEHICSLKTLHIQTFDLWFNHDYFVLTLMKNSTPSFPYPSHSSLEVCRVMLSTCTTLMIYAYNTYFYLPTLFLLLSTYTT